MKIFGFYFLRSVFSAFVLSFALAPQIRAVPAKVSSELGGDSSHLVVDVRGIPPVVPAFFSAAVEQAVRVAPTEIDGEARIFVHLVQGKPELLILGLSGDGEVVDVSGKEIRDWAVRHGAGTGKRFLDLHLNANDPATAGTARELNIVVRTRLLKPTVPGTTSLLLVGPGEAVGFSAKLSLETDAALDSHLVGVTGWMPVATEQSSSNSQRFVSSGNGTIELKLSARGGAINEVELLKPQLQGRWNEKTRSVDFRLQGQLRVQKAGARLRILSGHAALNERASGDGWHVELAPGEEGMVIYDLVGEREGLWALDLPFAAGVVENGDWRTIDFTMPAGAVVPLLLEGLEGEISFKPDARISPTRAAQGWQGFLPADGVADLAWKRTRTEAEGALFFTSSELAEVRVGAGLLHQESQLSLRVLQGKLTQLRIRIEGAGQIVQVEGSHVLGWKIVPSGNNRYLDIQFSRALEGEEAIAISSQIELGAAPYRSEPTRLIPEGGIRHSGFLRVANDGAVRLEVAETQGLMQLAPEQFPGEAAEDGTRQVFVYRFPSSDYRYRVIALQIQPEVSVSEIALYELGESDRVIEASVELDIREAPLHDWTLQVPGEYTVVSVAGADVADYAPESQSVDNSRGLKIVFGKAVQGRQLVELRLEKNQIAAAENWVLRPLKFPGAKSVRGYIGVVSKPGYRVVPATADKLIDIPLSYFPKQITGLQQAWRLRDSDWSAGVTVEALAQSVQADVFHLYTVKEGAVYGSVLINYFVVGAPATEWRIELPSGLGNIDVVGQNVRRDWRREGNQIVVSLHQPVLGPATLLVTFEQPMSVRGGTFYPGEVRPVGVQSERGFVQVVSPLQVKHAIHAAEGSLLKLEPLELPTEYRLLNTSPALATYQYTGRPFKLELGVEWYAPGETVDQVVDYAKLTSHVSRDGEVVTDARYFVKTRGRKALRLELPSGVKLWEARVDNEIVTARVDGEQTLLPLPARMNPNDPVAVSLRLGQSAPGAKDLTLVAPRTMAPTVIEEWILQSDAGRVLVPRDGNLHPLESPVVETGFELLSKGARSGAVSVLFAMALAAYFLRHRSTPAMFCGGFFSLAAIVGAVLFSGAAALNHHPNLREVTYAATTVPVGETLSIRVANLSDPRAMIVSWGLAAVLGGMALCAVAIVLLRKAVAAEPNEGRSANGAVVTTCRILGIAGVLLFTVGLLAQHGGAVLFFAEIAVGATMFLLVPALLRWMRQRSEPLLSPPEGPASGFQGIAPLLAIVGIVGLSFASTPTGYAAPIEPIPQTVMKDQDDPLQSLVQTWSVRQDRVFAEADVVVRARTGQMFSLLRAPGLLTDFKGDGLRVVKVEHAGETTYHVVAEREGVTTAHFRFEMPFAKNQEEIAVPTGRATMQRVTVEYDQPGWEFFSASAVEVIPTTGLGENRSGAALVLAPLRVTNIQLRPKQTDAGTEASQFFAELNHLYVPGPGAVNGYVDIAIRPVQGRISGIDLEVPQDLTIGDVTGSMVARWRFDPTKHRVHVAFEPGQTALFHFRVETQSGTPGLPFAVSFEPLRVVGAAGNVGTIALGFGNDAQPERLQTTGLSEVNVQDFDPALLPKGRDDQPLAAVQRVWRYGQTGGRVELTVAPVSPEVRVASRQLISLDDDRLTMAVDLNVAITRVGLFKLSFALPDGLEIEAASGAALSQWTETQEGARRVVTLHLNGRTLGDQTFALTLAGTAPRAQASWNVPKITVNEATRQSGEVILVPGKGLHLRTTEREKVTQLDPRTVGGIQPGTLAFRVLQEDWHLSVGIEALEPWATVQSLQEVTVREGQALTRIAVRYRVENAAVKLLRVKLTGLGETQARTVRASGSAVSDIVKTDEADMWEIRFQRAIVGETEVQIEFQGSATASAQPEGIMIPVFVGARQVQQFVAVRAGGRLELGAPSLPRGWSRIDWTVVPAPLQNRNDRSVPALCFRVAEPEGPLVLDVRRHEAAEALKLRVTQGDLTTLFSPTGTSLTAVELKVDVLEKSPLEVRLPEGSKLFNTMVNGECVSVVREKEVYLFHVTPSLENQGTATVRMVYAASSDKRGEVDLVGPSLSIPLENVTWRVIVPSGYGIAGYRGALKLRDDYAAGVFTLDEYQSLVASQRSTEAKKAVALLKEANTWLQRGDQQRAGEVLSRASSAPGLDEASNEDARVQLRNLRTQQTVIGLATRRQRLYMDNRGDAAKNEQLERAANLNPFMQGKENFDPREMDQLLMGNTAEENAALRGIANRLVDQQLQSEPAPGAIDVTLPERGRVFTFTRSVQVDGRTPLDLELSVRSVSPTRIWFLVTLLAGLAGIVWMTTTPQKPARAE